MLWFVGIGVSGTDTVSDKIKKVLGDASVVYFESFTSPSRNIDLTKIRKLTKGEFKVAKRWMVEDGKEILNNAKKKKVVLISYGDPYIATTHIELRTRAIQEKIKTNTIHASSAVTALIGECGLHYYKVGRVVTIMSNLKLMSTPYYVIYKNLVEGNHTVLLLEYNQDEDFFLDPRDAFSGIIETEKGQKRGVVKPSTYAIVCSRIGVKDQSIYAGKISSLKKINFGKPPHSIIIPGRLHFTEYDSLKLLVKCLDVPFDNSDKIKKISSQMLEKYIPMIRDAIKELAPLYKNSKKFKDVLINAELYIKDAQKFLDEGKDEVAILCVGYADGLVDALRMGKGIEPKT